VAASTTPTLELPVDDGPVVIDGDDAPAVG
jgi:hypothetical protein